MEKIALKCGRGKVEFEYNPENVAVLGPDLGALFVPKEEGGLRGIVLEALENPIGSESLSNSVVHNDKILILHPDSTRNLNPNILPILLDYLNEAGVPDENISMIIARGSHKNLVNARQKKSFLGKSYDRLKNGVVVHSTSLKHITKDRIGVTSRGTSLYFNRKALDADVVISLGQIVYHWFNSYGGGAKSFIPGIAGLRTIKQNHSLILNPSKSGPVLNPYATFGNAYGLNGFKEENPVHEDKLEGAKIFLEGKECFILNTVQRGGDVLRVFAGNIEEAHKAGCKFLYDVYRVKIDKKADLAIVSCGGYPFDSSIIQINKSITTSSYAVRNGNGKKGNGTAVQIILTDKMKEPDPNFVETMRRHSTSIGLGILGEDLNETRILRNYKLYGHTAYNLLANLQKRRIIIVSRNGCRPIEEMGFMHAGSLDEAVNTAYTLLKKDKPETYIINEAHTLLPVLKK